MRRRAGPVSNTFLGAPLVAAGQAARGSKGPHAPAPGMTAPTPPAIAAAAPNHATAGRRESVSNQENTWRAGGPAAKMGGTHVREGASGRAKTLGRGVASRMTRWFSEGPIDRML